MGKKNYKYKTEFFGIPIPGNGDTLSEEIELKRWNIIENQLLAANQGVYCCVFEEGEYRVIDNVNGTYTIMLVATGQHPILIGILNGGYVRANEPIVWQGLRKGSRYHLYITATKKLYEDEYAFLPTTKKIPMAQGLKQYLYLAKVDCTGDVPNVDLKPDGKIYSSSIATHANDVTNPHGVKLYQDEIVVRKAVWFEHDDKEKPTLLYDERGHGALNKLLNRKVGNVNVASNGTNGTVINLPDAKKIHFAQAEEFFEEQPTFKLGDVAIKYPSVDDEVQNKIVVFNSGDAGIMMKISVMYE